MLYLLYILIILAVVHFVYEAILAPSFRLQLRFKLFALRDELRRFKIEERPALRDDDVYRMLQGSINNGLSLLHRTDLATVLRADRRLKEDPQLNKILQKRLRLQASLDGEAKAIHSRIVKLFGLALLVNNGVWILYLLPIAVVVAIALAVFDLTSQVFSYVLGISEIIYVPENRIEEILPSECVA
jgi:hypothetical protein